MSKIVAEMSFNRDDEKEEFGEEERIVSITTEEKITTLSLALSKKEDSIMGLTFSSSELMAKLIEAIIDPEG